MAYAFYIGVSFDIQHNLNYAWGMLELWQLYPYLHNDQTGGYLHNDQTDGDLYND